MQKESFCLENSLSSAVYGAHGTVHLHPDGCIKECFYGNESAGYIDTLFPQQDIAEKDNDKLGNQGIQFSHVDSVVDFEFFLVSG